MKFMFRSRRPARALASALFAALLLAPSLAHATAKQSLAVVIGGGDEFATMPDVDARLDRLKEMGFTSVQTYIYWNQVEKSPGVVDWSIYDRQAKLYQKHGLKWVPFIIMSPWYVTPEFVRQDPQITMFRCVEHGRESLIPSIWSPRLKDYVREYLQRFAAHFRPMGVLESIDLGISGDYGEAIYSVIGNWPGAYHSHNGYWCADPLAAQDLQRHLQQLYPAGIGALNTAWKSRYASFADIKPFLPAQAPSERAWQEFLAWYRGAMTAYADWCLAATREAFPEEPIYLCTGGDMSPEHGSDFSAQAQIAAKHRAGIRITNEASSYPVNVRYTRIVSTASRHYGAYFGHEPAASVTRDGMLGRIFNAVTAGADQLFSYYNDEFVDPKTLAIGPMGAHVQRYRSVMNVTQPRIDTAVYFPNLSAQQMLSAEGSRVAVWNFGDLLADLRRFIDYDLVDDRLVQDGALDDKSILIVATTQVMDARTIERLEQWVRRGGVLFLLASRAVDWDGDGSRFDALAGLTAATDQIDGISADGILVPRPDVLPSIASLNGVIFTRAYTHLAPDAELLLAMKYAPQAGVAWRRKLGAGSVYTYFGPMDLKQDEASWVVSQRLPLRFMRDSIESCIKGKILRKIPPTLVLDMPDVYKVNTDAGLWILNMGAKKRTIEQDNKTINVPALSIVHP